MNKTIEIVKKWIDDPDSVDQDSLKWWADSQLNHYLMESTDENPCKDLNFASLAAEYASQGNKEAAIRMINAYSALKPSVLELAQQIYNDQMRLGPNRVNGYGIVPMYHYEQLTFSVSVFDGNYDPAKPKYMRFDADCNLLSSVGFQSESIDFEERMLKDALKKYLAQEVK